MDTLALLKKAATAAAFLKLDDLEIGKRYPIDRFELLPETKYGATIVVYIDDELVYLPKRFTKIFKTEADIEELNRQKYVLIYSGRDVKQHNKILVDFELDE